MWSTQQVWNPHCEFEYMLGIIQPSTALFIQSDEHHSSDDTILICLLKAIL